MVAKNYYTYIEFISKLFQFVFIFAHHSNYGTLSKYSLHQRFSESGCPASYNHMLIGKICWLTECVQQLCKVAEIRHYEVVQKETSDAQVN